MNLTNIQTALFAAYDIRKSLSRSTLKQSIHEASFGETVGSNLDDVIAFLEVLEAGIDFDTDDTRSNGLRQTMEI